MTKKKSPVIKITKTNGNKNQTTCALPNTQDLIYKLLCSLCQSKKILPSYSGFISIVNDPRKSFTKIVIILFSRNLSQSSEQSKKLRNIQKNLPTRLDNQLLSLHLFLHEGVCMKAYPLV